LAYAFAASACWSVTTGEATGMPAQAYVIAVPKPCNGMVINTSHSITRRARRIGVVISTN
jgi:uncharacterized protein YcnI